jgi:hypothetical protein
MKARYLFKSLCFVPRLRPILLTTETILPPNSQVSTIVRSPILEGKFSADLHQSVSIEPVLLLVLELMREQFRLYGL